MTPSSVMEAFFTYLLATGAESLTYGRNGG
jgi:hypothetical protein